MEVAQKNPGKRRREDSIRARNISEAADRERYAKLLREDDDFQRYVVKVWDKKLADLLDIRQIPNGDYKEMGELIVQAKVISAKLEEMIKPYRRS